MWQMISLRFSGSGYGNDNQVSWDAYVYIFQMSSAPQSLGWYYMLFSRTVTARTKNNMNQMLLYVYFEKQIFKSFRLKFDYV